MLERVLQTQERGGRPTGLARQEEGVTGMDVRQWDQASTEIGMNQERPELWLQNALVIHLHLRLTSLSSEWRSPREQSHCPSLHTAHSEDPALHDKVYPSFPPRTVSSLQRRAVTRSCGCSLKMEISKGHVRHDELSRILRTHRTLRRC